MSHQLDYSQAPSINFARFGRERFPPIPAAIAEENKIGETLRDMLVAIRKAATCPQ